MSKSPAVEPVVRSRLLPRISFQSMLILMGISAIVMAVAQSANQGGRYASAAAAAFGFLLLALAFMAAIFLVAWSAAGSRKIMGLIFVLYVLAMAPFAFSGTKMGLLNSPATLACGSILGLFLVLFPAPKRKEEEISSPFAADQLPPQILPPRDPQN